MGNANPTKKVSVDVQPAPDGKGNSNDGRYNITCVKEGITVHKKNTDIIYQLTSDTPKGIVFTGFTAVPDGQLGAPSITGNGSKMTSTDALSNLTKEVIKVTLQFSDGHAFDYDPEVTNDPQPDAADDADD